MTDTLEIFSIIAKLALYLGFLGATGLVIVGILFERTPGSEGLRLRKPAAFLAALGLLAALLSYGLRAAFLTGDLAGMLDSQMLGLLWQTAVGEVLIWRALGGVVLLTGLLLGGVGRWISVFGGGLALWSFTMIGHVPEIDLMGVRSVLFLHLLGVSFWAGILLPLRRLSLSGKDLLPAAQMGHRFGQMASLAVPVLLIAGGVMAWRLVGSVSALFTTPYGLVLVGKILLVSALLLLAALNKMRFVPAMQRGEAAAARHLTRSIEVEAVLILLVLAFTAALTSAFALPTYPQ